MDLKKLPWRPMAEYVPGTVALATYDAEDPCLCIVLGPGYRREGPDSEMVAFIPLESLPVATPTPDYSLFDRIYAGLVATPGIALQRATQATAHACRLVGADAREVVP